MAQQKSKMDARQTVFLSKVLEQHCHGDGDVATYEEGWDDDRVLAEVSRINDTGRPFTRRMVAGLRLSLFGRVGRNNPAQGLAARVEQLEAAVADLIREVEQLRGRRPRSVPPAPLLDVPVKEVTK